MTIHEIGLKHKYEEITYTAEGSLQTVKELRSDFYKTYWERILNYLYLSLNYLYLIKTSEIL